MTDYDYIKQLILDIQQSSGDPLPVYLAVTKRRLAQVAEDTINDAGYDFRTMIRLIEQAAHDDEAITYSDLERATSGRRIGVNTGVAQISRALGSLTAWFWANDLPLLNVYVVNSLTQSPGEGFKRAAQTVGLASPHDNVDDLVKLERKRIRLARNPRLPR